VLERISHISYEYAGTVPLLSKEEELELFLRLRENKDDIKAIDMLCKSHLRLVYKEALMVANPKSEVFKDCVSSGCEGLLKAIRGFDLDEEARLSTYSRLWIRHEISMFLLRVVSLITLKESPVPKTLFFNFRKAEREVGAGTYRWLTDGHVAQMAEILGVTEKQIRSFSSRFMGELSLDAPVSSVPDADDFIDNLVAPGENLEDEILKANEHKYRMKLVIEALDKISLSERDRDVFRERRLKKNPPTLKELGEKLDISKERVRQIEWRVFYKIQNFIRKRNVAVLA